MHDSANEGTDVSDSDEQTRCHTYPDDRDEQTRCYTYPQVAAQLSISLRFTYKLIKQGELPTVAIGSAKKARRVRRMDLVAYLNAKQEEERADRAALRAAARELTAPQGKLKTTQGKRVSRAVAA